MRLVVKRGGNNMKIITVIFFVALISATSWCLGYRTGALDEGIRLNEHMADVREAEQE